MQLWLNEKFQLLAKEDYGRDAKAADKLLTKHKVPFETLIRYCHTINRQVVDFSN